MRRFCTSILALAKPQVFALPFSKPQDQTATLAIRVWTQPSLERESDAGGIHIAPRLGLSHTVVASYRLQWLETFRGYIVDVLEPLVFVGLALFALISRRIQQSEAFAMWTGTALLLTALLRLNQALFFWSISKVSPRSSW